MLRKISHIIMALMLVTANLGLTISTHYCQGEAIESQINLSPEDLNCGMMGMSNLCNMPLEHRGDEMHIENIPCCENEYHTFQLTEDFVPEVSPIIFNVDFALAFVYVSFNLNLCSSSTQQSNTEYQPPPIEKDIQVLFQTFLI